MDNYAHEKTSEIRRQEKKRRKKNENEARASLSGNVRLHS